MINLSKSGDTIVFSFINNGHYLENGTIEVPVNSLSLVTDSSNMATFYKADSGDIFISATYDELGKTKAEMLEWFEENMVGGGGIDSGAVQTQIDQSISGFADSVLYNSTSKYVEFYHGGTGGTKVYEFDASDFVIDGMIDDVRIETISGVSYLVIDFNTASGKEDIQIPLTDIFDPSNYYTKTDVDGIVSGKTSVVNLTQAEYDALVTGGTVDPTVLYNITDATPIDMSQYWTSAETNSAITQAVSGKLDTSTFETYSGSVDTALSGKQDTLSAGTNITIVDNVISATGGGGGKSIEAGRGISITTGETADTVSFNLPISADSNTYINAGVGNSNTNTALNILIGSGNTAYNGNWGAISGGTAIGFGNEVGYIGSGNFNKSYSFAFGYGNKIQGGHDYVIGEGNNLGKGTVNSKDKSFLIGYHNTCTFNGDSIGNYIFGNYCTVSKSDEFALGKYNASNTGSTDADKTFFSIGNGTSDNARHNAFEIRQNGDIYITSSGTDIKLQDNLGSAIEVSSAITSGDTNPVQGGVLYDKFDEVEQVTAAALNNLSDNFDGLKLKKLTQAQYDALSPNYDNNTLYVII